MMPLDKQLQQLTSDAPDVDPGASLARVVRRARRRGLVQRVSASVAGMLVLGGAAVAAPGLFTPDVPQPAILHEGTEGAADPDTADGSGELLLGVIDKEADPEPETEPTSTATPTEAPAPVDEKTDHEHEPEPEPDTDHEFTAHQAHDEIEGDPPTNTYWGTGAPGDEILVWSEHGSARGTVADNGAWELTVSFVAQPPGTTKTFAVKVYNESSGTKHWFEVTSHHTGEPEHLYTAHQAHDRIEGDPPTNVYWGTAAPGHAITIWSNHQEAWKELGTVKADANGDWEIEVSFGHLPHGTTSIQVKARNISTNEPVYFELEVTNHGGEEPVAFTANQVHGTSADEVPWDVFWGTANPGDKVKIWSEYQAEPVYVTANEHGDWEQKVYFEHAPRDVTFDVHVRHVATGETITFQFTATTA